MFARFTPVFIVAMIGTIAASKQCTTVCCENASLVPTGWQGSPCTLITPDEACAYTKLCCYETVNNNAGIGAGSCTEPIVD